MKPRDAAKPISQYDKDMAEIKDSLILVKWMIGINLGFIMGAVWLFFA